MLQQIGSRFLNLVLMVVDGKVLFAPRGPLLFNRSPALGLCLSVTVLGGKSGSVCLPAGFPSFVFDPGCLQMTWSNLWAQCIVLGHGLERRTSVIVVSFQRALLGKVATPSQSWLDTFTWSQ